MLTLALLWLACAAIALLAILRAPLGFQDRDGFHDGSPEQ